MALNYNINSRQYSSTSDQYGIDPLLNKVAIVISQINTYVLYDVKQTERGRPDLVSYNHFGDSNYWWIILSYNGLVSFKELKEGITIRIPTFGEVTKILANQASLVYGKKVRTVSI